jgi:hypothetical protein
MHVVQVPAWLIFSVPVLISVMEKCETCRNGCIVRREVARQLVARVGVVQHQLLGGVHLER